MTVAIALLLAFVFGGADQHLGSLPGAGHTWASPWATELSLLAAPWLVVPFLAGWTQDDRRRGALLGLGCTLAAIAGYGVMTLSPIQGAEYSLVGARGFLISQSPFIAAGLFTGPLFGWLGSRWRRDRLWLGPALLAAAFWIEPVVKETPSRPVVLAQVAAGLAFAAYVAATASMRPRGGFRGA